MHLSFVPLHTDQSSSILWNHQPRPTPTLQFVSKPSSRIMNPCWHQRIVSWSLSPTWIMEKPWQSSSNVISSVEAKPPAWQNLPCMKGGSRVSIVSWSAPMHLEQEMITPTFVLSFMPATLVTSWDISKSLHEVEETSVLQSASSYPGSPKNPSFLRTSLITKEKATCTRCCLDKTKTGVSVTVSLLSMMSMGYPVSPLHKPAVAAQSPLLIYQHPLQNVHSSSSHLLCKKRARIHS